MCKTTSILSRLGYFAVAGAMVSGILFAQELTIRGRIVSQDGTPIQGDVTLVEVGRGARIMSFPTDTAGGFSITANQGTARRLVAKAYGFVSTEMTLPGDIQDTNAPLSVVLTPAVAVSGRVVNEAGVGVGGAVVRARYPGDSRTFMFAQEVGEVKADDYGYFELPFVAQGKPFVLDAITEDRPMSSSWSLIAHGNALTGAEIRLSERAQVIQGRVTDLAGEPVSGARVRLIADARNGGYSLEERQSITFNRMVNRMAITDAKGVFRFQGVPAGKVVVVVGAGQGSVRSEATVTVAPVEVNLVLPASPAY